MHMYRGQAQVCFANVLGVNGSRNTHKCCVAIEA